MLQGGFENLSLIRPAVSLPLLCKEFVVDAYQLFKARASGADAVLLIAAVLPNQDLRYLMKIVRALGLTALIEVRGRGEGGEGGRREERGEKRRGEERGGGERRAGK